jgi:hypothetical protein
MYSRTVAHLETSRRRLRLKNRRKSRAYNASPAETEEVKDLKPRLAELEKLLSTLVPTMSKK